MFSCSPVGIYPQQWMVIRGSLYDRLPAVLHPSRVRTKDRTRRRRPEAGKFGASPVLSRGIREMVAIEIHGFNHRMALSMKS